MPEVATIREAASDYYIFAIGFAVASSSYNGSLCTQRITRLDPAKMQAVCGALQTTTAC